MHIPDKTVDSINTRYYLVVNSNDSNLLNEANQLAAFTHQLHVLHCDNDQAGSIHKYIKTNNINIYLALDVQHGLSIVSVDTTLKPVYVKDIYTKINQRTKTTTELLIQAIKEPKGAMVFDLTAGFGKDAIIMAKHGYKVTMVEQNPMLATILYYALQHNHISPNNLTLIFANSITLFDPLSYGKNKITYPDVIYLDPMFNHKKAAKPKKDMQLIQEIVGLQQSSLFGVRQNLIHDAAVSNRSSVDHQLFTQALQYALKKVVVKRDNKQQCIANTPKSSYIKLGKTVRYDVYCIAS